MDKRGPSHGYGIANAIQELSEEALRIEEGSLYPRTSPQLWSRGRLDLCRMGHDSEKKRRARIYEVTKTGKKQLSAETERWRSYSTGVAMWF